MPKSRIQRTLLFLLIALVLFSLSITKIYRVEGLRGFIISISSPPQKALTRFYDAVSGLLSRYLFLVGVAEENERLKEEVGQLKFRLQVLAERAREAERLRGLLGFKEATDLEVLPARVIGLSPNPQSRAFFIDRGLKDGVRKGMAVVTGEGVVGRIGEVAPDSALVVPVIERGMRVSVLLEGSRTRAVLEGLGWSCRLLYVPKEEEVREGDRVITSGLDGVFPKGLWVGEVRRVKESPGGLFLEVEVRPFVDFSRLEEVLVVVRG